MEIWAILIGLFDLYMLGWFLKLCWQFWPRTDSGKLKLSAMDKLVIVMNAVSIPAFIYMVLTGAYS